MKEQIDNKEMTAEEQADALLLQLLHLKKYETPDPVRMVKNKQNIMRLVREANSKKRKSLGEMLEINIPWFFAEPRYGIAVLFVAFAGLQFVSHNRLSQKDSRTGIYTSSALASFERHASAATNSYFYPSLPPGSKLFDGQRAESDVKFVGRLEEE